MLTMILVMFHICIASNNPYSRAEELTDRSTSSQWRIACEYNGIVGIHVEICMKRMFDSEENARNLNEDEIGKGLHSEVSVRKIRFTRTRSKVRDKKV